MALEIVNRYEDPRRCPLVMGILNVTPDSFSDPGRYIHIDEAVEQAISMFDSGADIIDVGPESTRPGSNEVPADQQIERAIPIIRGIKRANPAIPVSIDTRLASVAKAAIREGACMVNDVSALRDDPAMSGVIAESGVSVVLMHRRGTSETMQRDGGPRYDDVIGEIASFFKQQIQLATSCGISTAKIILDPGIGFGKRVEHNLMILRESARFAAQECPILIGASRKSFIGKSLAKINPAGAEDPLARISGSLACAVVATLNGASILRVHDVAETVQAVKMCMAVLTQHSHAD